MSLLLERNEGRHQEALQDLLHKLENVKFERKIFKPSLQPMDFICMDLIGEFHPLTSRGHRYALTAVCMLTGFHMVCTFEDKDSRRGRKSIYGPHLL